MFNLLSLAFRNLTRSKARSAITLGAVLFGVLMSLSLSAYLHGIQTAFIEDVVQARVGALQIHHRGYFSVKENQPLKLDLPEVGDLESKVKAIPGVENISPRLVFSGLVSNGTSSTLFVGQGVDPVKEAKVLPRATADITGRPVSTQVPSGVVVGSDLAKALNVAPGSTLIIQASSQQGQENALDVDVVGTLTSGNLFESKRIVSMPLAHAQKLLRMEGRVTEYAVSVKNVGDVDQTAARIRTALGNDYEVHTWAELRPAIFEALQMQTTFLTIICSVFLVITVFGVVNTTMMSVMERTREIGTMLAVGVKRHQVGTLFVLEATAQAVMGGLLGTALAFLLVWMLVLKGGMVIAVPGAAPLHIIPAISSQWLVRSLVGSTVGAILAALFPALKASRLRPVEALRAT